MAVARRSAGAFRGQIDFARWAPGVLADYIESGTEPADTQVQLRFRREVETQVYNSLPHHLGGLLRRHLPRCPVALVAGTRSVDMRQGGLGPAHALVGERLRWIDGGHLFPMERRAQTATTVLHLLQGMRGH